VAGAMAEAAKANLELAKLKTPRSLSVEQQERIISKIKSFAGTPFDLWISTDPDSAVLMELIDTVLRSAGWKFSQPYSEGIMFASKAGLFTGSGVEIRVPIEHKDEWIPAGIALADALSAEGITTAAGADPRLTWEHRNNIRRDRIHVSVGTKPLN